MAVTDYKTPGTAASVDRDGKVEWTDVDYAKASDDDRATCQVGKEDYGDWLRLTNFGFSTDDIPDGATIDGIEVKIEHKADDEADPETTWDSALYLRKTASQAGDNKASATPWSTEDEEVTYGASDDDWNSGLADSDIRDSGFGIDLSSYNNSTVGEWLASIDCVWIRVYYTVGGVAYIPRHSGSAGVLIF